MLLKPPMPLHVQGRSSTGPPCYLPTVLLLSCLLLTTLYLMRHDNKQVREHARFAVAGLHWDDAEFDRLAMLPVQLAAAEGYIRQMKQHVNDLEEEVRTCNRVCTDPCSMVQTFHPAWHPTLRRCHPHSFAQSLRVAQSLVRAWLPAPMT